MEEQIVSFETAKLAEEKGFGLIQRHGMETSLYTKDGNHTYYANYGFMGSGLNGGYISAPTQSLLQKWLREVHKINTFVGFRMNTKKWDGQAHDMSLNGKEFVKQYSIIGKETYDLYEDALEVALIEGLNMISHAKEENKEKEM